ncbi:MAG: integration host factor subunit beta [Planctomycetes bacterium]|nr:integration host factor subunit beta [Planctomycetota bacterium]
MATITKRDLTHRIAERINQTRVVTETTIQTFLDEVIDELARGNRLELREFGIFEVKMRAARQARNPQSGATVHVPARAVVHFKAGRRMKALVPGSILSVGANAAGAQGSAGE